MSRSISRTMMIAAVGLLLAGWVVSSVIFLVGNTGSRRHLIGPLVMSRSNLRAIHLGSFSLFVDDMSRKLPSPARVYLQVADEGRGADGPESIDRDFAYYTLAVFRLFPREVYAATPGSLVKGPRQFLPGPVREDSRAMQARVPAERPCLDRPVTWMLANGFDFRLLYNEETKIGEARMFRREPDR
jgi:hypothetical protein